MQRIKKLFFLDTFDKQKLLTKYALIFSVSSFAYPFFWGYVGIYLAIPVNIFFGILLLTPILFARRKIVSVDVALDLVIGFRLLEVYYLSIVSWHHSPLVLAWLLVIPLTAFLLMDGNKALLWGGICFVFMISVPIVNRLFLSFIVQHENYNAERMQVLSIVSIGGLFFNVMFLSMEYANIRNMNEETLQIQNEGLIIAQQEIIETQKYKDRFFANISHELRTPMNAIKGISELLEKTEHNDEDNELIGSLKKSSDHLLSVINDILDYSKIQEGKLHIIHTEFDLADVLQSSFNLLKYNARQKSIDYRIKMQTDLPNYISGDAQRLKQIIANMLSNAIKFTDSGFVEMRCFRKQIISINKTEFILRIEVEDTGIGISKENIERIFESYNQADDFISLKFGGTGLGLNICKKLIEMQKGRIGCSSKEDAGSVFFIEIPFQIVSDFHEQPKNNLQKIVAEINPAIKILIADDNNLNLVITKKILLNTLPHAQIDICEDGEKAILKTMNKKYDLVLMDMQMPNLNGEGATRKIRNNNANPNWQTSIVALTANVSEKDLNICLQSGMNDVLIKPFELKELIAKIHLYGKAN